MALEIEEARSVGKWDSLSSEWDALLVASDEDDVFLRNEWLRAWWEIYGEGRKLDIVTVRREGELVGVAPLMTTRIGKLISLSIEEFIGTGQSDRLGAFVKDGGKAIQKTIWSHVRGKRNWDVLDLRDMRGDGSTAKAIDETYSEGEFESSVDPFIPIHGSCEDLLRGFSSNFRHSIVRSWTRLKEDHNARIEVLVEPERMAEGLGTLVNLSRLRWEGRGRSVLEDDKMRSFLKIALSRLSKKGEAAFHVLHAKDGPIAITLGFYHSNRYLYYLSGFDPAYQSYGPGRSLLVKVLEDCFARDLKEMDLLRGDEDYKFKFNPEQRHFIRCRYGRGVKASLSDRAGH